MPKHKGDEDSDPDFVLGKSRKSGFYDPGIDDRGVHKQLIKIKCKYKLGLRWAKLRST